MEGKRAEAVQQSIKPKFQIGDIVMFCEDIESAWWRSSLRQALSIFKIRDIEYYGQILQYRIVQWDCNTKGWVKPWSECEFFQSGSGMEKYLKSVNRLYLLVKYGIG